MKNHDVCIYFEVYGLGQDEEGKPCWAGMKITIGKSEKDVPYSEIQKKILSVPNWAEEILQFTGLNKGNIKPENVNLITPEEYDQKYGDNEEAEGDESC